MTLLVGDGKQRGRTSNRPPRILLALDEEDERRTLERTLCSRGYEVEPHQGQRLVDHAARFEPQVVVLDLQWPDLDGFAMLAQLKSDVRTNTVSVLVVSGSAQDADVVRALELGATDHVVRPIRREILGARLEAILRARREKETLWRLAEDLRRAQAELANARRAAALGAMAASLAHEINNPSAFVIADLHGLREIAEELRAAGDEERAEAMRTLVDESLDGMSRISNTVRDLGVFAAVLDPRSSSSSTPVDPVQLLRRRMERSGNRVAVEVLGQGQIAPGLGGEDDFDALCGLLLRYVDAERLNEGPARVRIERSQEQLLLRFESPRFHAVPADQATTGSMTPPSGSSLLLAIGRELASRFGGKLMHHPGIGNTHRIDLHLPLHR